MEPAQGTIRVEAEWLKLSGFRIEYNQGAGASNTRLISLRYDVDGQGTATGTFKGPSGVYDVQIGYYDENDGKSTLTVTVDGNSTRVALDKNLPSGNPDSQSFTTATTHQRLALDPGDLISIKGLANGGEYARLDYIDFIPVTPGAAPDPDPEPAPPPGSTPGTAPDLGAGYGAFEAEVFRLTNEFRVQNGRSPLELDARLNESAEAHSRNMAEKNFFSHTGKDSSNAGDRMEEEGYNPQGWGENIAAGQTTPQQVVQAWINSSGHRANMLNANWKDFGVGYYLDTDGKGYKHYWTQNFGVEKSSGTTPAPAPKPTPTPDPTPNASAGYGAYEAEVLRLTNEFRVQNGRQPLELDNRLNKSAETHSQKMADLNFFSHTGKDGSRAGDRMEEESYDAKGWGENIAAGQKTPAQVVQAWIDSSGHRANMLNSNWKDIGIGYVQDNDGSGYTHYWTQNFGVEYGLA